MFATNVSSIILDLFTSFFVHPNKTTLNHGEDDEEDGRVHEEDEDGQEDEHEGTMVFLRALLYPKTAKYLFPRSVLFGFRFSFVACALQ